MKFKEFRAKMRKSVFSIGEARIIAHLTDQGTLKLQVHQWVKAGDLIRVKRGLYAFPDSKPGQAELASALYGPCYISLESALNVYGLIPDVPFTLTLVTTKTTRSFQTPFGGFSYRRIKPKVFSHYDPGSLMAEKEKALVDYLYLNKRRMKADPRFWQEERLQNLRQVDFDKAARIAALYRDPLLNRLLESVRSYAKSS